MLEQDCTEQNRIVQERKREGGREAQGRGGGVRERRGEEKRVEKSREKLLLTRGEEMDLRAT